MRQPQGHSAAGRIMSITPSGIKPATFRVVSQCFNHIHHRVPPFLIVVYCKCEEKRERPRSPFYIPGSVHRNSRLKKSNKMQQYADIYLPLNYSTCFGRPSCPSSGVHKTVVAASGTGHTIWGASFLKRDLHYTCRHFTSSHLNFTQPHFTPLHYTSPKQKSLHFTNLSTLHFFPFNFHPATFPSTSLHFTQPQFTPIHYTFRHFTVTQFLSALSNITLKQLHNMTCHSVLRCYLHYACAVNNVKSHAGPLGVPPHGP